MDTDKPNNDPKPPTKAVMAMMTDNTTTAANDLSTTPATPTIMPTTTTTTTTTTDTTIQQPYLNDTTISPSEQRHFELFLDHRQHEMYTRRLVNTRAIQGTMERICPRDHFKIDKEVVTAMREMVTEMIGFVTHEAVEMIKHTGMERTTMDGDDIIDAVRAYGFGPAYSDLLEHGLYLQRSDAAQHNSKRQRIGPTMAQNQPPLMPQEAEQQQQQRNASNHQATRKSPQSTRNTTTIVPLNSNSMHIGTEEGDKINKDCRMGDNDDDDGGDDDDDEAGGAIGGENQDADPPYDDNDFVQLQPSN